MVLSGFIVVGQYFINVWAGIDYNNAYYVALLLIIPVTVPLIQNLGIEIQRAKNKHKFRSIVYFLIAIGNVLISIPLVKLYGEIGAALGTAICLTIGNIIIMNWYYQVKIKLDMFYFWKQIFKLFPGTILSTVLGIGLSKILIVNSIIHFLIVGLFYVCVYLVCLFTFGMNAYEKNLIKGPINKILKRG